MNDVDGLLNGLKKLQQCYPAADDEIRVSHELCDTIIAAIEQQRAEIERLKHLPINPYVCPCGSCVWKGEWSKESKPC